MSEPFPFARSVQSLDELLDQASFGGGWQGLEKMLAPAKVPDSFDPGQDMKKVLCAFYHTTEGRRIIDWLMDLTVRAPYPHVGTNFNQAAIAAAKHESRAAVGLVILQAIAEGDALLHPQPRS